MPGFVRARKSSTDRYSPPAALSSRRRSIVLRPRPLIEVRPTRIAPPPADASTSKPAPAAVGVRPQDAEAVPLRFGDVLRQLVVAAAGVEHGREIRHRLVDLEVDGLVGHVGVGGAVGLVEGVGGELLHGLPQPLDLGRRVAALAGLAGELGPERRVAAPPLLQAPPQEVALLRGHAGHPLGDLHDLLLVEEDAAGLGQDAGEKGVVGDGGAEERPRPLRRRRSASFMPLSVGPGRTRARAWVISWMSTGFIRRRRFIMAGLSTWKQPTVRAARSVAYVAASPDGSVRSLSFSFVSEMAARPRTERRSSLISRRSSTASLSKWVMRRPLAEVSRGRYRSTGPGRQDDAADVEGDLVVDVLELGGELPDVEAARRRGGQAQAGRLGEIRHALRQAPRLLGRDAERAERLVEGRAAAEALEAADVGRAGLARAVALEDVLQDLVAAPGVEIDVDVGRVGPAAVEEALEIEIELHRADVGDAEEPAQEGRGPRSPQVVEDAAAAGELDDVVDGEEVGAEARLLDRRELAAGPLALLPGQVLRRREPLHDDLAEGPGEEVGREVGDDVLEDELALFGDLGRPGQGVLGGVAEAAQGQRLLVRPEEPHLAQEPVALRRVGDLLLDGVEEDEALRARQVLEGVGPDDGQSANGTCTSLVRVPVFQQPTEVPEIRPEVEVARRDLLPQLGQHRGFARPAAGRVALPRGTVPLRGSSLSLAPVRGCRSR